ncbi:hypothetical protein CIB48_g3474 [Xylaria polymorpha]|nr:hypothetical protein CIB48_g3474 [Xylaria polymorpha]
MRPSVLPIRTPHRIRSAYWAAAQQHPAALYHPLFSSCDFFLRTHEQSEHKQQFAPILDRLTFCMPYKKSGLELVSRLRVGLLFVIYAREEAKLTTLGSTLSLFSLATMAHIAMSLSPTTILLYVLATISIQSGFAIVIISRPEFVFVPVLGYGPVIIAFMLWIIEDCSRFPTGAFLQWWTANIDSERYTASTSPTMMHGSRLSFRDSIDPDSKADDIQSTISAQDSLLFRFWSPSQSGVPSSRLSDISLSSRGPESLPSSWGTLTRIWFPDFSAQGQHFGEPNHTGCQRSRTV